MKLDHLGTTFHRDNISHHMGIQQYIHFSFCFLFSGVGVFDFQVLVHTQ